MKIIYRKKEKIMVIKVLFCISIKIVIKNCWKTNFIGMNLNMFKIICIILLSLIYHK